ncbi:iron ABC transporter permease [Micrococcus flavus]|uniref:Thiamine transport system permease protein n=2 Tax=Micrococcus TaxID=1269 RepID=A0A4Y8X2L1_9MICC|nr:ABC transporter permease subunit [Micrococcus flavus]MBB4881922.1 thiamine transport system permease protein [Micrococcus flavus]TFI03542.1 iron ABC transporter permease [Micrococcus flavus]GGK46005.1 iron ABC transporter permease [Micrococcus flavus]
MPLAALTTPARPPRRRPAGTGAGAGWLAAGVVPVAFLLVFFAWPVAAMLWRGVAGVDVAGDPTGALDLSAFAEVLGRERTWRILGQTLGMAAAGTAASVALGLPAAFVLHRRAFPGRTLLRAVVLVPFVLPTVVVGVAFRALLAPGGPFGWTGLDQTTAAVVLAMVFFNVSVVVRQVGALWAALDPRQAEAARTLGASPTRAFLTVTLPQLGPALAGAAALVFLFCASAFGIVQTLGRPGYGTLESEIWVQTAVYLDLRTAAVFSILQLAVVLAAVALSGVTAARARRALRLGTAPLRPLTRTDALPAAATALTGALVLAPLAALVIRSFRSPEGWGLRNYTLLATSPGTGFAGGVTPLEALEQSARTALDATVVTLLVSVPLALLLTRPFRSRAARAVQRALDGALLLPLGVSAVTVGFGFVVSLRVQAPELAASGALVPIAQAVVAVPLAVRALVPVLAAVDPRLREAARTLGAGPARVLATVDGPFLLRGVGLAAGFAFAVSLGEFGATSFLAAADRPTLPVLIARLLGRPGADNYGMALAAATVLAVLSAGVMLACERLRPREAGSGGI